MRKYHLSPWLDYQGVGRQNNGFKWLCVEGHVFQPVIRWRVQEIPFHFGVEQREGGWRQCGYVFGQYFQLSDTDWRWRPASRTVASSATSSNCSCLPDHKHWLFLFPAVDGRDRAEKHSEIRLRVMSRLALIACSTSDYTGCLSHQLRHKRSYLQTGA